MATFPLYRDKDLLKFADPKWIAKNLIPESGIGIIFGASQTYKSFLTLDLLAHIARGSKLWFGHRIKKKVHCVYVPLEGKGGIPKRVAAWRHAQARKCPVHIGGGNIGLQFQSPDDEQFDTGIYYFMDPVNLRNPLDRLKFIDTLKSHGFYGCLICIDTLSQMGAGLNENSPEGMGELIKIMQEIQAALGGVVMAIHHTGKETWRGMRGHSSLGAALDFAIECERQEKVDSKYHAQFTIEKMKDGESGLTYTFSMERIVTGTDEDGDDISSLVVITNDDAKPAPPPKTKVEVQSERDAADEDAVFKYVQHEQQNKSAPTGAEIHLASSKWLTKVGRDRIYDAIDRLVTVGRLIRGSKGQLSLPLTPDASSS